MDDFGHVAVNSAAKLWAIQVSGKLAVWMNLAESYEDGFAILLCV